MILLLIKENIQVYFSGNEGFHVYVFTIHNFKKLVLEKDQNLTDYISLPWCYSRNIWNEESLSQDRCSFYQILMTRDGDGRFSKQVFGSKSKRSKIIYRITFIMVILLFKKYFR